jgi:hypothetical protein
MADGQMRPTTGAIFSGGYTDAMASGTLLMVESLLSQPLALPCL